MTTSRPSFEEIYMELAHSISKRSTCKRLKVGTVITSTDFRKVLAVGYNGNATGLDNSCDSDVPGSCMDIHSEANAMINCDVPRYVEKLVFVTHSPCIMCAKMLINLGNVKKVYYTYEYRKTDSIELLQKTGIPVVPLVKVPVEEKELSTELLKGTLTEL
jgi:dCMP deaminase